jgi:hypothetical protein
VTYGISGALLMQDDILQEKLSVLVEKAYEQILSMNIIMMHMVDIVSDSILQKFGELDGCKQ